MCRRKEMNTKAKEFLKRFEHADRRVKILEEEYEKEREMIDAVRSLSDNDGMPHGSGISKPTEERAVRLADKAMKLADARWDAIEERQKVFDIVNQIDGLPGEVLYHRYVKLLRWEEVCVAVHKSWNVTHGYHREGLQQVSELLEQAT